MSEEFQTGAKRSKRMPRYDLIPKVSIDRLAERFTGDMLNGDPTGGALKYGEGNWEKGLPTSDVINHVMYHITNYAEKFRMALTAGIHAGLSGDKLMDAVRTTMLAHTKEDDDLAGAMWGITVLMVQEGSYMYHDDKYKLAMEEPGIVKPLPESAMGIRGNLR